jgi:hypothetical protein
MKIRIIKEGDEKKMFPVRGYYRPESSFHTIKEWEHIAKEFLDLESQGYDVRGGEISDNDQLTKLVNKYFGFQLYNETELFPQLTKKMVLDFIEDFVNHRVWSLKDEYKRYIVNLDNDKIAFFYSRGALEPYILLDDQFTIDTYDSTDIQVTSYHYTTEEGYKNIVDSIDQGIQIPISTFTTQFKEFFRPESNILLKLKGNLVAAFQSDVKSISTDRGHKAANLYRFSFPDHENNLCRNWEECQQNKTYLWNEIIMTPTEILDRKKVKTNNKI